MHDPQNGPTASCCPRNPNIEDFMGAHPSGVCLHPSGSKSDGLFLKIASPKPHCCRRVLTFDMSHVYHFVPRVASLTMVELFKARAIKQNEMLKESCL